MRAALLLVPLVALGCDPTASSPLDASSPSAWAPAASGSAALAPGSSAAERGPDGKPTSDAAAAPDAAARSESWLTRTLVDADPRWRDWLVSAKELRLEILVTVVEPGAAQWPTHELRVDEEYFYPASAVKPFIAIAALRAMSQRAGADIALGTRILRCRDDRPDCEPPTIDEEKEDAGAPPAGEPEAGERKKKHEKLRVGEEVTKLLSYSDNDSYNRLYDIVGHRELNEAMVEIGFPAVRFHHRMDAPAERSRRTLRVLLMPPGKRAIEIPRRTSDLELAPTAAADQLIGLAHFAEGRRIDQPMSFEAKNYVPLRDLQRLMQRLLFPDRAAGASLGLSEEQRALLIRAMTARLGAPRHAAEHNPLSPGVLEVLAAERVRYVGKSGRAYGFHLENAFIEELDTHRGLFVTATVYANPNGVLNDDDYGYDEISRPLLSSLGAALSRALLARPPAASP